MKIALVLALVFCASALNLRTATQTLADPFTEQVHAWLEVSPDETKAILADEGKVKAKVDSLFAILDTDKSGLIGKDELKAFYRIANPNSADTAALEDLTTEEFNKLDTDHNGTLDRAEFQVFARNLINTIAEAPAAA